MHISSLPTLFLMLYFTSPWLFFFFPQRFCLFIFREREREREREAEKHQCVLDSWVPNWGSGLQPRHVPWLGIELATLLFTDRRSIHWATPARAPWLFYNYQFALLNPFCLFAHPLDPSPSGNHQNILCIYDSLSVLLFVCFLDSIVNRYIYHCLGPQKFLSFTASIPTGFYSQKL